MSDKEYQLMLDLLKRLAKEAKTVTPEEAQETLYSAGILDKKGNFTKPYRNIGRYCKRIK